MDLCDSSYNLVVCISEHAVGSLATRYGLDGPGIESRGGDIFRTRPGAHPATCTITGTGSFSRGVNRPGASVNHPHPSNAEVKERVDIYLHSLSGPSWLVRG
jgi:hypothetical protein